MILPRKSNRCVLHSISPAFPPSGEAFLGILGARGDASSLHVFRYPKNQIRHSSLLCPLALLRWLVGSCESRCNQKRASGATNDGSWINCLIGPFPTGTCCGVEYLRSQSRHNCPDGGMGYDVNALPLALHTPITERRSGDILLAPLWRFAIPVILRLHSYHRGEGLMTTNETGKLQAEA